ncbi:MAG: hypothetical protein PHQ01_03305 [Candidatus Pacebacteria bacterium]|jgi:hypothetical protein|nr:hypothetical protein [Candidatus Paceibacterota bacterium]
MLSQEIIKEFKQAILEDYEKEVDLVEAGKILTDLVGYFDKLAEIHYNDLKDKDFVLKSKQ